MAKVTTSTSSVATTIIGSNLGSRFFYKACTVTNPILLAGENGIV